MILSNSLTFFFFFMRVSNQQIKTPINFWCMRNLNFKYFIQLLEILTVELTGTHLTILVICASHNIYLIFKYQISYLDIA